MADYKRKYNEWVRFQAEEVTQDYGGTPAVANPSVPCCWFNGLTSRMAGVEQSKSVSGLTYGSGFTRWRFIRQSLLQPCGSTHHQSIVRWYRVDTCWGLNQSVKASLRVYSISPEAWISLSKKKFSSGDFCDQFFEWNCFNYFCWSLWDAASQFLQKRKWSSLVCTWDALPRDMHLCFAK